MDFKHPLRSAAALTLSAALLFCPAAQAEENRFTDVSETDWFYPYVMDLSEKKVINGYPDGTFQPQNTVTAGEALALIVTAAGNDSKTPTEDHWASGYASFAVTRAEPHPHPLLGLGDAQKFLQQEVGDRVGHR